MDIDKTIDSFRLCAVDLDCKKMVLSRRKVDGERFEGQGYIRQTSEGALTFKIYVTKSENVDFAAGPEVLLCLSSRLRTDEEYYDLTAVTRNGTTWNANKIIPNFNWDMFDLSVLVKGNLGSITADLKNGQSAQYLRLHFFEEYNLPLHLMSKVEEHGNSYMTLDHAQFESCGSKFEIREREGSGDTIVEATSHSMFPPAFPLRIQEALQFLTGKTALWRARVATEGDSLSLELASPQRRSLHTQFRPPISPASIESRTHGWKLFDNYLSFVVNMRTDTQWNLVAYHLHNACESTANSIDAWAMGVSVAVEAIASLVKIPSDDVTAKRINLFQKRMREYLNAQTDFKEFLPRMGGLIDQLGNKRTQDTLHALSNSGYVKKSYINYWKELRNRQVHPTLQNLKKPDFTDFQKLLDQIHCVEVLLYQLIFHLIKYEGPFSDYGVANFPVKQYPLDETVEAVN